MRSSIQSQQEGLLGESTDAGSGCLPAQLRPTLCDPMDCMQPGGNSVHGISQVRILEWVAIRLLISRTTLNRKG